MAPSKTKPGKKAKKGSATAPAPAALPAATSVPAVLAPRRSGRIVKLPERLAEASDNPPARKSLGNHRNVEQNAVAKKKLNQDYWPCHIVADSDGATQRGKFYKVQWEGVDDDGNPFGTEVKRARDISQEAIDEWEEEGGRERAAEPANKAAQLAAEAAFHGRNSTVTIAQSAAPKTKATQKAKAAKKVNTAQKAKATRKTKVTQSAKVTKSAKAVRKAKATKKT
ncbi:hypothetical protein MBLNU459_g2542t1 [Dothideomycetes sp. NU459]